MKANSHELGKVGLSCGLAIGLKLLDIPIEKLVPSRIDGASPSYVRGLLGIYSLAENIAVSLALVRHSEKWAPAFRRGLAEGIRGTAIREGITIRLFDILRLRAELEHFCEFYLAWLRKDGPELVMGKHYSFQEAFTIMQELRSLEFAAFAANAPTDMQHLPLAAQKFSGAAIRAAHMWVLQTTTFSGDSMVEADNILEPVCEVARGACDTFCK